MTSARIYLNLARYSNGALGASVQATPAGDAGMGNLFQYDAASGHYRFNLSTATLTPGTWQLRLELMDGVQRTALITLR